MGAELLVEGGGKGALRAGGDVGFDVAALAHPGNDGADAGIAENEAQRHLRHGVARGNERPERFSARDAALQIFRDKVSVAPIALRPLAINGQRAGECAFIERHAGDDGDIFHTTDGEEGVLGILVEDIVDDLDGVGDAFEHGANAVARFPAIDADAYGLRFATGAQLLHRAGEAFVVEPAVFPSVKLNEIEFFDAEIGEAFIDVRFDVVRRIAIIEREIAAAGPLAILGRNFRGDVKFFGGPADSGIIFVGAKNFSEDLFAAAVAVSPRGVEEIATEIDGALQGVERFGVVGAGPAGESPHAVTNFTDVPSGAAKAAVLHEIELLLNWESIIAANSLSVRCGDEATR